MRQLFSLVKVFHLFFFVFVVISLVVFIAYGSGSSEYLIEQMLHREQVIVRSGSSAIRSLLTSSANSLVILASNDAIITPDSHTEPLLRQLVANWHGTSLNLIALIDLNGHVISAASNQNIVENYSASAVGRDYFEEGKKLPEGKFYIGQPVYPRLAGLQQKPLIPVSVPVYQKGKVVSILVCTYYISDLLRDYLDPLKVSNETDILVVDIKGNMIISKFQNLVGQNIFSYVKKHPFLGDNIILRRVEVALQENIEHKFDIVIPSSNTGKLTRTLIASSPINFPENSWRLVITTPVEDAFVFAAPYLMRQLTGIIVIIFINIIVIIGFYRRFVKK